MNESRHVKGRSHREAEVARLVRSAVSTPAPPVDPDLPEELARRAVAGAPQRPSVPLIMRRTMALVAALALGAGGVVVALRAGDDQEAGRSPGTADARKRMSMGWTAERYAPAAWEGMGFLRADDAAELRRRAGEALPLPTETLGRRLDALLYKPAGPRADGSAAEVVLLYRDRLLVQGVPAPGRRAVTVDDAQAAGAGWSQVDGVPVLMRDPVTRDEAAGGPETPGVVVWIQGGWEWRVYGESAASDLVRVARSMFTGPSDDGGAGR